MKIIFCGGLKIVVELNASACHCDIFIKLAVAFIKCGYNDPLNVI